MQKRAFELMEEILFESKTGGQETSEEIIGQIYTI